MIFCFCWREVVLFIGIVVYSVCLLGSVINILYCFVLCLIWLIIFGNWLLVFCVIVLFWVIFIYGVFSNINIFLFLFSFRCVLFCVVIVIFRCVFLLVSKILICCWMLLWLWVVMVLNYWLWVLVCSEKCEIVVSRLFSGRVLLLFNILKVFCWICVSKL